MRSPILSAFFGLMLIGCTTGEISGGGGDDDDGGPVCGNGVMEGSETCDDGNVVGGDGCSATCSGETARVDVSVDMPSINTELSTSTMLTLTVKGADGFRGPVNLAATVVDAAEAPITGWTVNLSAQTVNVAYDSAPVTVVATLAIPSDSAVLTGSVKVTATSTAGVGTNTATTMVTALNQVTVPMTLNGGQCVYPADGTLRLKVGSKLRFMNNDTTSNITIHMQGGAASGLQHQGDPGSAPGTAYEQTITGVATGIQWYCHAPGPTVGGLRIETVQ